MTNEELQQLVEEVSLRDFGKPFKHRVVFNARLRTTGGRYHLADHHIDINPRMLTVFGQDVLVGIIKHELVHYHLHLSGLSGKHGTKDFKQMLAAVGGLRYAPRVTPKEAVTRFYEYTCQGCGQVYQRRRHIDTKKYVCSRCRGPLALADAQCLKTKGQARSVH